MSTQVNSIHIYKVIDMVQQKSNQPSNPESQSTVINTSSTTLLGKDAKSHAPIDSVRKSSMSLVASGYSCQGGEGSYTASETRNTKMIRRKPELKHRHHRSCRENAANIVAETRIHTTLVSIDSSSKDISAIPTEQSGPYPSNQDERSAIPTERAAHYPNNVANITFGSKILKITMPTTPASADKISTHKAIVPTEQSDESSDVSEESSVEPELDPNIPKVDCSLLAVVKSQFRADNGKGHIADIGRGLTCHSHIIPQQEISMFVGKVISYQEALGMSADRRSYVIEMSTPLTGVPLMPTMLDCYEMSKGASPFH
jgi:hypothetical protein